MVLGGDRAYKAPDMTRRLSSRVLPLLAAAATFLALEPAALAQKPPAKPAPAKPAPASATPTPASAPPTPAPAASTPAPAEPAPADDATKEDPRAIYLSGELGFTRADIGGFTDTFAFDKTGANGLLAGLGLGYRYKALRIGARFRDASTTEYSLWSLMGEVGFGLPFRPLTPIIFLRAGYIFDEGVERSLVASSLPRANVLTPNIELDGLVVGAEAYIAYSVTKFFKVGPFIGLDLTFLHRAQPGPPQSLQPIDDNTRNNALFGDSGSGVGYMLNLGLRVTGDVAF